MVRAVYQLDRKLAARAQLADTGASLGSQQLQAGVVGGEHEQHGCAALSHRLELVAQVIPQRDNQIARQAAPVAAEPLDWASDHDLRGSADIYLSTHQTEPLG